ncbi:MAG: UBP-type zinc finger domain-containing protein [Streptosporangiaceae bacterium]
MGCCDSSALRHARSVGHPIVRSSELGESWCWCYADEQYV